MYKNTEEVKQRIDLNYQAIKQLEQKLDEQTNNEDKLGLIAICGLLYSEFVTGVYGSKKLEQILSEIGSTIEFEAVREPKDDEYLIVMTKAYDLGGHSVIANNWLVWDRAIKYSIVFTDSSIADVPFFLKEAVQVSGGKMYFLWGSHYEKAKQLLDISQSFSKVILLQHMFDIVPSLAYCNPKWKIPVVLYNHANFKFSFGYKVSDAILNLVNYDVEKTICYRGVCKEKSLLLQFPNGGKKISQIAIRKQEHVEKEFIAAEYGIDTNKKLIVSMGEGFKFNDIVNCSFISFVKRLMNQRSDIQYIIIGPNPNEKKWKELEEATCGMAKAVGYLKRDAANEIIGISDLYVNSFPMSASGSNIAEEYGVPYLFMTITGRGAENYDINVTTTIEELLEKSNEILDGNKEKYKGTYYKRILDQDTWCAKWHDIADGITVHTGQKIEPQRHIHTEEIVNCQLMQERAGLSVKNFLSEYRLTPQIAMELFEICRKYDLHFMPDHFLMLDWNVYNKNMCLSTCANKWLQLRLKGLHLSNYFERLGIYEVAIYGMGQMGLNLYEELKDTNVKVECFIDKNANKLHAPINIIDLKQKPNRTFYIINTAYVSEGQLRAAYTCLTEEYKIISLYEIIERMILEN